MRTGASLRFSRGRKTEDDGRTLMPLLPPGADRDAQVVAQRLWLMRHRNWRYRVEMMHLSRRMYPTKGWAWLYERPTTND